MKRLTLFFIAAMASLALYAETLDYPVKVIDGKSYYVYTVQKSEGYYAISKRFNVTIKEIVDVNGEGGLKLGQELLIPQTSDATATTVVEKAEVAKTEVKKAEAAVTKAVAAEAVTEAFKRQEEAEESDEKFRREPQNSVRIAVLMPFNMAAHTESDDKFVDFYRGCLIAADSLKASGYNVTIDTYDIGKTKESLYNILSKKELRDVDLIIGPAYSAQTGYVADFAERNHIKTIIPFSNNVPQVKTNKYLFQVVCPQQELYPNVVEKCLEEWKNKKVLVITPDSAGIRYDKKEFSDMLVDGMVEKGIYYKYIAAERMATEVNALTSKDSSDVVIVAPTTNHVKLTQLSDHFDAIKTNRVYVFGFPEWNDLYHKDIYGKPLYTFSNYWLNFNDAETVKFYKRYNQIFGVPLVQNNPSYSIFGFDITLYFGKAWCDSGRHFEQYLDKEESEMLQMNFDFEKVNGGGYANHGVYLHLYDKEGIH